MAWYLLAVVPQREKSVAERLSEINEVYFPRRTVWARVRKSQVKKVGANRQPREHAAFSGYLFVKAPLQLDRRRKVDGLISFVGIGGVPVELSEELIDDLKNREKCGEFNETKEPDLSQLIGSTFQLRSGPLKGIAVKVSSIEGKTIVFDLGNATTLKISVDEFNKMGNSSD